MEIPVTEFIASSEKLRRLEIARDLFDGLLKDDDGYSEDVKLELEKDLAECESKITDSKFLKIEKNNTENNEKSEAELKKNAAEHFTKTFHVELIPAKDGGGFININDIRIKVSQKEYEMCVLMFDKLKDEWLSNYKDRYAEAGWVSYEEFEQNIAIWKNKKDIDPQIVNKAFWTLNSKIKKTFKFKNNEEYLIENGKKYGFKGHYRFKVHPDNIVS